MLFWDWELLFGFRYPFSGVLRVIRFDLCVAKERFRVRNLIQVGENCNIRNPRYINGVFILGFIE